MKTSDEIWLNNVKNHKFYCAARIEAYSSGKAFVSSKIRRYPKAHPPCRADGSAYGIAHDVPLVLYAIIKAQNGLRRWPEADRRHNAPNVVVHPLAGGSKITGIPIDIFAPYCDVYGSMVPI